MLLFKVVALNKNKIYKMAAKMMAKMAAQNLIGYN